MAGVRVPAALPVFRVCSVPVEEETLARVGKVLFGIRRYSIESDGRILSLSSGPYLVESYLGSGSLWAEDESALWNPDLRPRLGKAVEPVMTALRGTLAELRAQHVPALLLDGQPVALRKLPRLGATVARFADIARESSRRVLLDLQAILEVSIRVPLPGAGQDLFVPVVGGGGKVHFTVGDGGRPIGFSALWRPILGSTGNHEILPRTEVLERFRRSLDEDYGRAGVLGVAAQLAYYSAPASALQSALAPVWVLTARVRREGQTLPTRAAIVDARRDAGDDLDVYPAEYPSRRRPRTPRHFSVACTWCDTGSDPTINTKNAQGLKKEVRRHGARFVGRSNAKAEHRLWVKDSWKGVDQSRLAVHIGHACPDFWEVSLDQVGGNSTLVQYSDAGEAATGDRWGSKYLDWILICGCGPLQDDLFNPDPLTVPAMEQWGGIKDLTKGIFQGLHGLMGYSAVTAQSADEAGSFFRYARRGASLIHAWFRAARETQPSTNTKKAPNGPEIWASALYAANKRMDPAWDHLPGAGSRSGDPYPPTRMVLLGTRT